MVHMAKGTDGPASKRGHTVYVDCALPRDAKPKGMYLEPQSLSIGAFQIKFSLPTTSPQ